MSRSIESRKYRNLHHGAVTASRKRRQSESKSAWMQILKDKDMLHCVICGYNEHFVALDYHHVNPLNKKQMISILMRRYPNVETAAELDKCISVCVICHRLIHAGIIEIPESIASKFKVDVKMKDITPQLPLNF